MFFLLIKPLIKGELHQLVLSDSLEKKKILAPMQPQLFLLSQPVAILTETEIAAQALFNLIFS